MWVLTFGKLKLSSVGIKNTLALCKHVYTASPITAIHLHCLYSPCWWESWLELQVRPCLHRSCICFTFGSVFKWNQVLTRSWNALRAWRPLNCKKPLSGVLLTLTVVSSLFKFQDRKVLFKKRDIYFGNRFLRQFGEKICGMGVELKSVQ